MIRKHNFRIPFALLIFLLTTFYFFNKNPKFLMAGSNDNVSGYAWSDNVGWVSFNCINNGNCIQVNYGINVDQSGLFSGYAWSDNMGWISFNQQDLTNCPIVPCEARITGGLLNNAYPKQINGWAKVLSTNSWISLRGNNYGVQLESNGNFSGWSWEPEIIGWISWNGLNYSVVTTALPAVIPIPPPPPPPLPPSKPALLTPGTIKEIKP